MFEVGQTCCCILSEPMLNHWNEVLINLRRISKEHFIILILRMWWKRISQRETSRLRTGDDFLLIIDLMDQNSNNYILLTNELQSRCQNSTALSRMKTPICNYKANIKQTMHEFLSLCNIQ